MVKKEKETFRVNMTNSWNEMEEPTIASADEFDIVVKPRKLWYDNREVLTKALVLAKNNPMQLIKCMSYSDESIQIVETEMRKWKTNFRTHLKDLEIHINLYTRLAGNKFYGYIQYVPNAKRYKTPLRELFTEAIKEEE
tara:strand:- start:1 stop:417 length:417 start_codon:yes stop_codon:yes gene_type:complete